MKEELIENKEKIEKELNFIPIYEDLKDIETGNSVRTLISGMAGAGKTEFVATAGEGTLLINIGKGDETLKSPGFAERNPDCGTKIKVVNIEKLLHKKDNRPPTEKEMIQAVNETIYHATRTQSWLRTVAIDDMTEYRFYALWRGMQINKELNKSNSEVASDKYEMPMPVVQDFGTEMGLVEDFLRWLCNDAKDREYNVIVTSHTRDVFTKVLDDRGKPIMGVPAVLVKQLPGFTGQTFPDYIPRLFSIVGQLEPKVDSRTMGNKPRLRLAGGKEICVKHRYSGILPEYIDNPRFDKILEAIKSNRKLDTTGNFTK